MREYIVECPSNESIEIGRIFLREISRFIFEKYNDGLVDEPPNLEAIHKELEGYGISLVFYNIVTSELVIYSSRPGILIGVRGKNIREIENNLKIFAKKENIKFEGIKLKEDKNPIKYDIHYYEHLFYQY
jgi:ribosomal protein S3